MLRRPPRSPLFPYTPLFRPRTDRHRHHRRRRPHDDELLHRLPERQLVRVEAWPRRPDQGRQHAQQRLHLIRPGLSEPRGGALRPLVFQGELKSVRLPSDNNLVTSTRRFVERIQRRLAGEEGFTLVELTIVLLIIGILFSIAVPSYLSFKDRSYKTAAQAEAAQAMRSIIAYAADNYPNASSDPDA